jgi:hypothetical protein
LQSGLTLETTGSAYLAQQFQVDQFNVAAFEVTTGPRLPLFTDPSGPTLSVRPYAIGSFAFLDYDPFYNSLGAGLNFRSSVSGDVSVNLDAEFRHRNFTNTTTNPILSAKDGDLKIVRPFISYAITLTDVVGLTLQYSRNDATSGAESYDEYLVAAAYANTFAAPWQLTVTPWTAALQVSVAARPYRQIDPIVDPDTKRFDRDWTLAGTLNIPVIDGYSAVLAVQQSWSNSSLPNYRYDNTTVFSGLKIDF